MTNDEKFMKAAIELSAMAVEHGNEPFGAVLVKDGEIVYKNENQIYSKHDPTYHAEIGLLKNFCAETGISDLSEYTLYSSCEPCFMCCGAMVWCKLGRLVYSSSDMDLCSILGVQGSECCDIVFGKSDNHIQVTAGVLKDESFEILKDYFNNHNKG